MENITLIIEDEQNGQRLDRALLVLFPNHSTRERRLIWDTWQVLVNGKAKSAGHAVKLGDKITFRIKEKEPDQEQEPWPHGLNSLHKALSSLQMPYCIASYVHWDFFFKPQGLHSTHILNGGDNLQDALAQGHYLGQDFFMCNRLDAQTSGIIVVSKSEQGLNIWQEMEDAGLCKKKYLSLNIGEIPLNHMGIMSKITIKQALDTDKRKISRILNQEASPLRHSSFFPLARVSVDEYINLCQYFPLFPKEFPLEPLTLMACTIQKGARHQIRAHAAYGGFPLFFNQRYIERIVPTSECFLLHHAILEFTLPNQKQAKRIQCQPPWLEVFAQQKNIKDFYHFIL